MRILHTADWHAGRTLRGLDRTKEIEQALNEILSIIKSEKVDLLLVAGDIFDSPNPSADAESIVFEFFLQLKLLKVPSVVIAGNHDSAPRLESLAGLLRFVDVNVVGQARLKPIEIEINNETVIIAALPFLSERRLVKAANLFDGDVASWRQKYREGMNFFLERLATGFRPETINIAMLHTTFDGGQLSNSEHRFFVTNSYSISPESVPKSVQYAAVGHLHRPQKMGENPPIEYSGSLIQLDFGEAGEQKFVKLIEAKPGLPVKTHNIPLSSGKQLKNIRIELDNFERRLEEFQSFPGYLKVKLKLDRPMPGLKDRIMKVLPQALAVELEVIRLTSEQEHKTELTPIAAFERFYLEKRGQTLKPELKEAFLELANEGILNQTA